MGQKTGKALGYNTKCVLCCMAFRYAFLSVLAVSLLAGHGTTVYAQPPGWIHYFGGEKSDAALAIAALSKNHLVIAGYTRSGEAEGSDAWVLRLDGSGKVLWKKRFGGDGAQIATAVAAMPKGHLAVAVFNRKPNVTEGDAVVYCLNGHGHVVWRRQLGGSGDDLPSALVALPNGSMVVGGYSTSSKGGNSDADAWIFRLNRQGKLIWQRRFGGSGRDWVRALAPMPGGGVAAAGATNSRKPGKTSAWVIRLDKKGRLLWQNTYGDGETAARTITALPGGQMAIAGWNRNDERSRKEIWIARLNRMGKPLWERRLDHTGDAQADNIAIEKNGHLTLAGTRIQTLPIVTARSPVLIQVDDTGKVIWRRTLHNPKKVLYALSVLLNGRLAATGSQWRPGKDTDAWVSVLNPGGQLPNNP